MNYFSLLITVLFLIIKCSYGLLLDSELCLGNCTGTYPNMTCTFYVEIDIFASETGYYHVQGCNGVQPTLGMIEGVTYIFDQSHPTNWFHPLGFAYGPDGVYANNTEMEKVEPAPNGLIPDCKDTFSCQHPQYGLNGDILCDNPGACADEDFGLDQYEGVFFSGKRDDWLGAGNFSVNVTILDPATTEIFYFCHIHNHMSGRIKVLFPNGTQKNPVDVIPIPYLYHTLSAFDEECGTHNYSQFSDISSSCPEMTFICNENQNSFNKCMNAVDCGMHVEMRVTAQYDPVVTFMHQMIAHHRNAVNMAKILLKLNPGSLKCGTSYDGRRRLDENDEDSVCHGNNYDGGYDTITLLWEIINGQNQQITMMNSWLAENEQPLYDNCAHEEPFPVAIVALSVSAIALGGLGAMTMWFYMSRKVAQASTVLATKKIETA